MEGKGPPLSVEVQYAVGHVRQLKEKLEIVGNRLSDITEKNKREERELEKLTIQKHRLEDDLKHMKSLENSVEGKVPYDVLKNFENIMEYSIVSDAIVRDNLCILRLIIHELLLRTIHNERIAQRELSDEEASFRVHLREGMKMRECLNVETQREGIECEGELRRKRDLFNDIGIIEERLEQMNAALRLQTAEKNRLEQLLLQLGGNTGNEYDEVESVQRKRDEKKEEKREEKREETQRGKQSGTQHVLMEDLQNATGEYMGRNGKRGKRSCSVGSLPYTQDHTSMVSIIPSKSMEKRHQIVRKGEESVKKREGEKRGESSNLLDLINRAIGEAIEEEKR